MSTTQRATHTFSPLWPFLLGTFLLFRALPAFAQASPLSPVCEPQSASRVSRGDEHVPEGGPVRSPGRLEEAHAVPATGVRVARFLLGGASGLGLHEAGHLAFDAAFGVRPHVQRVDFGGIPFFAIAHRGGLPHREEYAISSAGFLVQHVANEIILVRRPALRHERAPLLKGLLAFNVLASVGYAGAAFAGRGPEQRDTRAMAEAARLKEPAMGAILLVPATMDAWRYFHPESRWARWASRAAKLATVLLVLR
jgi:hypothetical protein